MGDFEVHKNVHSQCDIEDLNYFVVHKRPIILFAMESYVNQNNSDEDFDNLDIKGRSWKENTQAKNKEEDRDRILNLKVPTEDGTFGYVFSLRGNLDEDSQRWRCHLCDVVVLNQDHVETHILSKKHQVKLTVPSHPRCLFSRLESDTEPEIPQLAPGEPVPPGFEDVVKRVAQIQETLDRFRTGPLIGLEYIVEIAPEEVGREPMYVCMMCDKKGDPRVVMAHLNSFNHCSKYIGIHFPTVNRLMNTEFPRSKEGRKAVAEVVQRICSKVEEMYGRLEPVMVEKATFDNEKDTLLKQIVTGKHIK
uniref:C2H2-type domain-containing protein n=1 Tax=Timema douglasi TaxID=61478 RepID=A0A7R8VCZ8_TIMDO|nr:unnamed protein product [Timema douglasi]